MRRAIGRSFVGARRARRGESEEEKCDRSRVQVGSTVTRKRGKWGQELLLRARAHGRESESVSNLFRVKRRQLHTRQINAVRSQFDPGGWSGERLPELLDGAGLGAAVALGVSLHLLRGGLSRVCLRLVGLLDLLLLRCRHLRGLNHHLLLRLLARHGNVVWESGVSY